MVELSRPARRMIQIGKAFKGKKVDFDEKDGPQCADFSAFLIKNVTGKTIWGNAIMTGDEENLDIINESQYIGHVSLITEVHPDGQVTVLEQNYYGDAETNPKGVEERKRNMADVDGWGEVEGYLRIEE